MFFFIPIFSSYLFSLSSNNYIFIFFSLFSLIFFFLHFSSCYTQNLTVCQLTSHVEYLAPHPMCPPIHMGSMETIKEQASTIKGGSPEELTPDEQGPLSRGSRTSANKGPSGGRRAGSSWGCCSPSMSTPLSLFAVDEHTPVRGPFTLGEHGPPGVAHPRRVDPRPGTTRLQLLQPQRSRSPSTMDPPSFILLHALSTMHFTSLTGQI